MSRSLPGTKERIGRGVNTLGESWEGPATGVARA